MISYLTGDRRSVRYDSGDWVEEVLTGSGVQVDASGWTIISGAHAQATLDSVDNVLNGLNVATGSGIILIDEVSNVSGCVASTLGNLDVITLGSGSNSICGLSFVVPVQPLDDVHIRLLYAAATSGASGYFRGSMKYNIYEQLVDLTLGGVFNNQTANVDDTIVADDFENMRIMNFTIPAATFAANGSAPFLVECQITRDVSVVGNYAGDIKLISIYGDNIPGAVLGNTAGYVGGNLNVTGSLAVKDNAVISGALIVEGGTVPSSVSDTGISGTIVPDEHFLYVAVGTNDWKRIPMSDF